MEQHVQLVGEHEAGELDLTVQRYASWVRDGNELEWVGDVAEWTCSDGRGYERTLRFTRSPQPQEPTREQKLEALVKGLVAYLNETNAPDCLEGYHNSLADLWVQEKDSTTFNQALEDVGLPTLEECEARD